MQPTTMRAAVVERYGPPENVRIDTVGVPRVRSGEVLIRVEAVAVTSGDARIRGARFPAGFGMLGRLAFGLRGPRRAILGGSMSGTVVQVGSHVTTLMPGDSVAGMNGMRMGGHAQFAAVSAKAFVAKPATVSHVDAAAALFGGSTAFHFLRDRVQPGMRVLVNGAAGSVGSSAVQFAHEAGAEVTAVTSAANAALATRQGAADVLDHAVVPLEEVADTYDLVFDAVGNVNRALGLRLAGESGTLILAAAGLSDTLRARGRVIAGPAAEKATDIQAILDRVAAGRFDPLASRAGGLDAVVDAHRVVDSGRKVGNLVVEPWL